MLKFFIDLFNRLLGKAETPSTTESTEDKPLPTPPVEPASTQSDSPQTDRPSSEAPAGAVEGKLLILQRDTLSDQGVYGSLQLNDQSLGMTLEGPENSLEILPQGDYELALKSEGGIHATYTYRFGDQHKGMLTIVAPTLEGTRHIKIGNEALYTYGSILVGTGKEPDQGNGKGHLITFSENAYTPIYQLLSEILLSGEKITLRVLDPAYTMSSISSS